jgi:hypothetical protein
MIELSENEANCLKKLGFVIDPSDAGRARDYTARREQQRSWPADAARGEQANTLALS